MTGLLRRALPFMGLALLADLGATLPSGPQQIEPFVVGSLLLMVVFLSNLLPWHRLPRWLAVGPCCLYVASAALVIFSAGPGQTAMLPMLLVPIMWTALYQRRWQSAIVIAAVVLALLSISLAGHSPRPIVLRRILFWGVLGVVIVTAAHSLRSRLSRALAEREELLRQADALSNAARRLTSLLQPEAVIAEARRLTAQLMSPVGEAVEQVRYFKVGTQETVTEWAPEPAAVPAAEYRVRMGSPLSHAIRSGLPACGTVGGGPDGSGSPDDLAGPGATHGAWIPVSPKGVLHGVLVVSSRRAEIPAALFERAISMGQMVELALSNALTLERSEREAATDPLTGLSNRRAFEVEAARIRAQHPFAVLLLDVDQLKLVNDSCGHAAGDELLVGIAKAAAEVMRREDLIARIGGDEFAAFLTGVSEDGACRAAERILTALRRTEVNGTIPSLSIGIACGGATSELSDVIQEADRAMYLAKRRGGNSYNLAAPALQIRASI